MQQQILAVSYASILGQMIRQLREKAAADQNALAERLGVSIMTISRIESGDTVLDVPQMEKVAQFFEMSPVDFFKKSLLIKQKLEDSNYVVAQTKKEINENPNWALLSMAALVALLAVVLFSKK